MTSLEKAANHLKMRFPIAKISKDLGFSKSNVSEYYNGKREMSQNFKEQFENFYKIRLEDFENEVIDVTGIRTYDTSEHLANKNGNVFELKNGKVRMYVKKVPVKAFGSYLSDFQDPDFFDDLEEVPFTVDHLAKGNYICFEVQGDSMNGGHIDDSKEGAELLCRELGRQHWKDGFRNSPLGWVIVHKDTILFKDIKEVDMQTGDMVLGSRSGLPQHPDFTINMNDVRQIWKVIKRTQD